MDHSSFSEVDRAVTSHIDLDLCVDFERRKIHGWSTFLFTAVGGDDNATGVSNLTLDTNGLTIHEVVDDVAGNKLRFFLEKAHPVFGSKLTIHLDDLLPIGSKKRVAVQFTTHGDSSTAVQFLNAEQTAGGKLPYLFTQCQAIHARSLLPCQDAPAAKITYAARVCVPESLTALMSALTVGEQELHFKYRTEPLHGPHHYFFFNQPIPIPSYLIALAVRPTISTTYETVPRSTTILLSYSRLPDPRTFLPLRKKTRSASLSPESSVHGLESGVSRAW